MAERLKDRFFTRSAIEPFAAALEENYPAFNRSRFLQLVYDASWESLALKGRLRRIAVCLGQTLPPSYPEALAVLKQAAPRLQGFEAMIPAEYVQVFGLDDFDLSLEALGCLTRFGSAEFAVRPFLQQDPQRALAYVYRWAEHESPAVRRLASEGCRPRLPWAPALTGFQDNPRPLLPVLEKLRDDPSESVRKSVANHLNDISKDHPDLALGLCEQWIGLSPRTDWIVKHACRTLLRAGNRRALALFGFEEASGLTVETLTVVENPIEIGGYLKFSYTLIVDGAAPRNVRLEYAVSYVKAARGPSTKVFQHTERLFRPGRHTLRKKHAMADMTTRKHIPGDHRLGVVVNGEEKAACPFTLVAPEGNG